MPVTSVSASHAADAPPAAAPEYLAFRLGDEEYAVDIQVVQELRGYAAVTRIAGAPDYLKGVVNLRGIIVPIVDMRMKLALSAPTYDASTVVVILSIGSGVMGMVVDSVSDVTRLAPEQIKPAPMLDGRADAGYVLGLASVDERMLIVVDIVRMMAITGSPVADRLAA